MTSFKNSQGMTSSLLSGRKGQMAIVFLILIVLGLIFYAMAANWSRLSQVRTQVSMAATSGAANLVSSMGSYGESLVQGQLEGKRKKCDKNGFFESVLRLVLIIVIIIIAIVITIVSGGSLSWVGYALIAAALTLGIATTIQAAKVDREITKLWNKMMQETASTETRTLEGGYQAALGLAVTDQEMVTDKYDFDMDGDRNDKINRFGYLSSMRLWNMRDPKCEKLEEFIAELRKMTDILGIADNECCSSENAAFCDPTCLPSEDATNAAECASPVPGFPFVYDPAYCSRGNTEGLIGFLGVDDWSKENYKLVPNSHFSSYSSYSDDETKKFIGWDSTTVSQGQWSLIPFLWYLNDTVLNISNKTSADAALDKPACHWKMGETCAGRIAGLFWKNLEVSAPSLYPETLIPLGIHEVGRSRINDPANQMIATNGLSQLQAVSDCSGEGYSACVGWQVDGSRIDNVKDQVLTKRPNGCPGLTSRMYGASSDKECDEKGCFENCKQTIKDKPDKDIMDQEGIWRPGADMFCAEDEGNRYYADCSDYAAADCFDDISDEAPCGCSTAYNSNSAFDPRQLNWANDDLDEMAIQLGTLAREASEMQSDKMCATGNVEDWYDEALASVRTLKRMSCNLRAWDRTFDAWLKTDHVGGYCYPQGAWPPDMSIGGDLGPENMAGWAAHEWAEKYGILDSAGAVDPKKGNLGSVLFCLNFNSNAFEHFSGCLEGCRGACVDRCDEEKRNCEAAQQAAATCANGCTDSDLQADDDACVEDCGPDPEESCLTDCATKKEARATAETTCKVDCATAKFCQADCMRRGNGSFSDDECAAVCENRNDCDNSATKCIEERCKVTAETGAVNPENREPPNMPKSCNSKSKPCKADAQCLWTKGGDETQGIFHRTEASPGTNLQDTYREDYCNNAFVEKVHKAAQRAVFLDPKFYKRYHYLKQVVNLTENIKGKLSVFADKIDAQMVTLEKKLDDLKNAAVEQANDGSDSIVYAWKGEPAKGQTEGTWHIVKAHGGVPKKCGGPLSNCGSKFPWTKNYKKGMFKVCYEIRDTDGRVGMQVSRWDQTQKTPLTFANGVPLWNFTYGGTNNFSCPGGLGACISCETCTGFDGLMTNKGAAEGLANQGVTASSCGSYSLPNTDGQVQYQIKLHGC